MLWPEFCFICVGIVEWPKNWMDNTMSGVTAHLWWFLLTNACMRAQYSYVHICDANVMRITCLFMCVMASRPSGGTCCWNCLSGVCRSAGMCVCTLMDAWLMMTRVIKHTHVHDCITKYVALYVWRICGCVIWNLECTKNNRRYVLFLLLSSWFHDLHYVSFSYLMMHCLF